MPTRPPPTPARATPPRPRSPCTHAPDLAWRLSDHLLTQRRQIKRSWRALFWEVAAQAHVFHCAVCQQTFPAAHINHCAKHPQDPEFGSGAEAGAYPCCGRWAASLAGRAEEWIGVGSRRTQGRGGGGGGDKATLGKQ